MAETVETVETLSPFEQMKKILSDKEAVINTKLEELESKKREWEQFQKEVLLKAKEVQEAQADIQKQKEEIAAEWEKIREAQDNLKLSMDEILAERVQQEQRSLSDFVKSLETQGCLEDSPHEEISLDELRKSVGIEVVPQQASGSLNVEELETQIKIPELFLQLEKEITKSYTRWTKLELLPERYCLQIGEKEIRFFDASENNKVPYVQIIVFTRNSKNDNKLLSNLAGASRVVPEWSVSTEDNNIVCTMPFTKETKVTAVLKKVNDFIKNYLN